MKLKKCILSGVLAASMLCESLFGVALMNPVPVYAAETASGTSSENVALGKPVTVSSYESGTLHDGSKLVDNNDRVSGDFDNASIWRSGQFVKEWASGTLEKIDQWAMIDLEATRTTVEEIEINFYDDLNEWPTNYRIETSASGREGSWTTVSTIVHESNPNPLDQSDRITRMDINEGDEEINEGDKIVLQWYVRFYFTGVNSYADSQRISVSEIRIFGQRATAIPAPAVEFTAPADNQFPKIARVTVDDSSDELRHQNLTDRMTPASTLVRATANVTLDNDGNANITPDMLFEDNTDFEAETNADGIWGFNALAKTVGAQNKFNADGTDTKVISFKLFMKKFSNVGSLNAGGGLTIYSKGSRYMMQTDQDCIKIAMQNANNTWVNEAYRFSNDEKSNDPEKSFLNKWHDILVVIDGEGDMRLYVDYTRCSTKEGGGTGAIHPDVDINVPFSLCCNASNTNPAENAFTSEFGYIAQFEFYTNASYHGLLDDVGTDITDATTLPPEVAEKINIGTLEAKYGARNIDVAYVISKLIQAEKPTARIAINPYNVATVWSKWVPGEGDAEGKWEPIPAEEKFSNSSNTKYCATTTLTADDGFVFNQTCRDELQITTKEDEADPSHTVVNLSNNNRVLTVTAYYNCTDDDEAVPGSCQLEELRIAKREIIMELREGTCQIDNPTVVISKCAKHTSTANVTYEVTEGGDYISVNETTGEITAKKKTKLKMGCAPAKIKVKAVLVGEDGEQLQETLDGVTELTGEITVHVHDTRTEDQTITTAPTITTKVPEAGSYPEIADIKMVYPDGTDMTTVAQFDDIEDRTVPRSTLNQTTVPYMEANIAQLIKNKADGNAFGLNSRPNDLPTSFAEPVIANTDGVWGFVGQGQTPGLENEFDVYGDDVKLITFKLYLKKWPTNLNVSLFGKGDKYAVQLNKDGKFVMYMENKDGQWPQEVYTVQNKDAFLRSWHDVFMVVDGKGKQRIYVDGNPSVTDRNYNAYAKERPSHGDQPFTMGYNLSDTDGSGNNLANWWRQMFTEEYGYIADFEFYTDKNYYGMIETAEGEEINIDQAQVLNPTDAKFIDIANLEKRYGTSGNIKTVLLNVLQQNNATAAITVTPYAAKTIWKEVKEDGTQVTLNPKDMIMGGASYISETTLTAYDGFKFSTDASFKQAVETNFSSNATDTVEKEATVSEDGKTLTLIATYGKTAEADCTCEISGFESSEIRIELGKSEEQEGKKDNSLVNFAIIKKPCPVAAHQEESDNTQVKITAAIKGDTDVIELNAETNEITAKKVGTATITVTAEYQIKNEDGEFETLTKDGTAVTRTADITVNVVRRNAADDTYKTDLKALISSAEGAAYVEEDYETDAWSAYSTALAAAKEVRDDADATKPEVDEAKDALDKAVKALPTSKSAVGTKKDEVRAAVNNEEIQALHTAGNANGLYTTDSWNAFETAYNNANGNLTGKSVDELEGLITALTDAKDGLVKEADTPADSAYKASLSDLIPEEDTYLEEDYDSEKLADLQDKIDEANDIIASTTATKGEVDEAKAALQAAIAALASAKTPLREAKDSLIAAVESAKAIYPSKKDEYTEGTWNSFEEAYNNANLTEAQMKGKTVDDLTGLKDALTTAQGALAKKPTTSDDDPKDDPKTPIVTPVVKDGDVLTGADKTEYKVASAKDKTVIITKGVDAKSIKVGPTVVIKNETYKVIGIGDKAYTGLKKATKVVIDANVVSIGAQAFANSKKLKNVTIGQDVTTIGKKAFFKCPKLAKVTVKNNSKLSKVGGSAFKKASKNIKIKLPKNLKKNNKLKKQIKKAGIKKGL